MEPKLINPMLFAIEYHFIPRSEILLGMPSLKFLAPGVLIMASMLDATATVLSLGNLVLMFFILSPLTFSNIANGIGFSTSLPDMLIALLYKAAA